MGGGGRVCPCCGKQRERGGAGRQTGLEDSICLRTCKGVTDAASLWETPGGVGSDGEPAVDKFGGGSHEFAGIAATSWQSHFLQAPAPVLHIQHSLRRTHSSRLLWWNALPLWKLHRVVHIWGQLLWMEHFM